MPALTTAALAALPIATKMAGASAAGAAIKAIPGLLPTKTGRANRKRLKELERLEEMGMLGLTDREETALRNRMSGGVEQAQRRADAEMRRLSANTAQPQLQMQRAQQAAQGRQDMESRIAQEILQLDLQRQAQQEQELRDVRAAVDEKNQDMMASALSPIQAGLEGGIQGMTIQQLFGTNMTPEQRTAAVAEKTGLTSDEVAKTFPSVATDGLFPQGASMPTLTQNLNQQGSGEIPNIMTPGLSFEQFKQAQQGPLPGFMTKPISQMTPEELAMFSMMGPQTIQRTPGRFDVLGG
jgi:hypothetical protein